MQKDVVVILPGNETQLISVPEDIKHPEFIGDKGARLSLYIEEFFYDEKVYLICRYSSDVSDEIIIGAIKKHLP